MKLKVKILDFLAGRPVAVLNAATANKMNVHVDERVKIVHNNKDIIAVIDTAAGLVSRDELLVSEDIVRELCLKKGSLVEVSLAKEPESTWLIRKKLDAKVLNKEELGKIMADIVKNALTETEIAYFVSAVYKSGMNSKEIESLIRAMVNVGERLNFPGKVVDKHSIGGVAGNRTTPLVVPICAAAGLVMPKTSSRAITSATGTADVIESIAKVDFNINDIKKIIHKTGACMVWGGSLGLSPADDKLIQVERILHLDPEPQLLASVLSKKISVGSDIVLIDIPYGKGAKVTKQKALYLKNKFENLAKKFNIKLKAVLTDGTQPIGNGIGPLLEIRDVILVLQRKERRPLDLEKKAVFLAGQIFELCKKIKKGQGEKLAIKILESGAAFKKFQQIILAQKGKIPETYKLGKYKYCINSNKNSKIKEIDNKKMNTLAILAGSPMDVGAGLYLYGHAGDKIKKGQPLLEIYSESPTRLSEAKSFFQKNKPIAY